jgi:hypothetical protein
VQCHQASPDRNLDCRNPARAMRVFGTIIFLETPDPLGHISGIWITTTDHV